MKQVTISIPDDANPIDKYPDRYSEIPKNGQICQYTGLKHAALYRLLSNAGEFRDYVRVIQIRRPGASRGKTMFHVGDILKRFDELARVQGAGVKRSSVGGE